MSMSVSLQSRAATTISASSARSLYSQNSGHLHRQESTRRTTRTTITNKWCHYPSTLEARQYGAAATIQRRRDGWTGIVLVGGKQQHDENDNQHDMSTEFYDVDTNMWTRNVVPPMSRQRLGCAAASLGDTIYVVGGSCMTSSQTENDDGASSSIESWTMGDLDWKIYADHMTIPRIYCAAVAIPKLHFIAVVGGRDATPRNFNALNSVVAFDVGNKVWIDLPPLNVPRMGCTAVCISKQQVNATLFQEQQQQQQATENHYDYYPHDYPMPTHDYQDDNDEMIVVMGGRSGSEWLDSIEVFNISAYIRGINRHHHYSSSSQSSSPWKLLSTCKLPIACGFSAATALFGTTRNNNNNNNVVDDDALLLHDETSQTSRSSATTRRQDVMVVLAGGRNESQRLSQIQYWNLTQNKWDIFSHNLPRGTEGNCMVQFGQTLFVMGGCPGPDFANAACHDCLGWPMFFQALVVEQEQYTTTASSSSQQRRILQQQHHDNDVHHFGLAAEQESSSVTQAFAVLVADDDSTLSTTRTEEDERDGSLHSLSSSHHGRRNSRSQPPPPFPQGQQHGDLKFVQEKFFHCPTSNRMGTYRGWMLFLQQQQQQQQQLPHGFGKLTFRDGQGYYEGEWWYGQREGLGKSKTAVGEIYVGSFHQDTRWGRGVYEYQNGIVYSGYFRNNQKHGPGTLKFGSCGSTYTGDFRNDVYSGIGRMESSDGTIYEGCFSQNMYHGLGKICYGDGRTYRGEFHQGKAHGFGKLCDKNGVVLVIGQFKHDRFVGDNAEM